MKHLRVGDNVRLKTDFHVISYDPASHLVSCKMYVVDGTSTKAVTFTLPSSMPVFKVGPPPHQFLHPTHLRPSNENFCTYTSEVASLVYLPKQKLKGRLSLPESFYFDGVFKLISTDVNVDGKTTTATLLLESTKAPKYYAQEIFDALIRGKVLISGALVTGKITTMFVDDNEVAEIILSKMVLSKNIVIYTHFAYYLQLPLSLQLLDI